LRSFIFSNIGISFLTLGIQFLLMIFTNRVLEPSGRGIVASLISWNTLYFTLGYFSLHIAIINLLPKEKDNIAKYIGSSIFLGFGLGTFLIFISLIFYYLYPNWFGEIPKNLYFLAISILPIMIMQSNFMTILQMSGELKLYNLHGFIFALFQLFLTGGTLLLNIYSVDIAIYIFMFNYFFAMILAYYFIQIKYKQIVFEISHTLKMIKVGIKAHIASVATFFASNVDILMINSMLGKSEAGIYFLAVMLARILLIIPRAVQNIFYHHVTTDKKENIQENLFQATRITILAMSIVSILLAFGANILVFILGGEEFYKATYILWILLPGFIFLSVPMILATMWNTMGIFKYLNIFTTIMITLVIILNYLFIPVWGIYGAALGTVLTYIYLFAVHLFFVRKFLYEKNILKVILVTKKDIALIQSMIKIKLFKGKKV